MDICSVTAEIGFYANETERFLSRTLCKLFAHVFIIAAEHISPV